jgi:hypothetical protein
MTIIRHTRSLSLALNGRGISTISNLPGKLVHYIIADSLHELGDFARTSKLKSSSSSNHWDMGLGLDRAISYCFTGDEEGVKASDELLSRMEEHIQMPSTRAIWTDEVSGAFPNIPAYIAGQPLNMRTRQRAQTESAPLAIMVDLGISAAISAQQVRNRGTAILALVRALSAHRPIELWAMDFGSADDGAATAYSFGHSRISNAVCCAAKIETSPLDLSTACYALTHPAFVRQVLFGLEEKYHDFRGGWPFRINRALSRHEMEVLCAPMWPHVSETLALPGLHVADQSMTDPEAWLKRQLAEHDPLKLEETID